MMVRRYSKKRTSVFSTVLTLNIFRPLHSDIRSVGLFLHQVVLQFSVETAEYFKCHINFDNISLQLVYMSQVKGSVS
jgi:hypothetical protein